MLVTDIMVTTVLKYVSNDCKQIVPYKNKIKKIKFSQTKTSYHLDTTTCDEITLPCM